MFYVRVSYLVIQRHIKGIGLMDAIVHHSGQEANAIVSLGNSLYVVVPELLHLYMYWKVHRELGMLSRVVGRRTVGINHCREFRPLRASSHKPNGKFSKQTIRWTPKWERPDLIGLGHFVDPFKSRVKAVG